MGGSSQTQNVQRGIIMIFFMNFALLIIFVIMRFCKKQIDIEEDDREGTGKKYREGEKQSQNQKESQEQISNDFDKAAVKRSELKDNVTCCQKLLHGVQQFVYYYCPYLILLPLNILTGTSKSFSLTLFFIITLCISLFNFGKLHRKIGEGKCINLFFENVWLLLCFFYCVNQWGVSPIAMPYIVK